MRLYELRKDNLLESLLETATASSTGAANIASVASPLGATIRRMPTEPNLFGYIQPSGHKRKNKRKKQR